MRFYTRTLPLCVASLSSIRYSSCQAAETSPKFKLALCQIKVDSDKSGNIGRVKTALREAKGKGANIAVLPECWNGPYNTASFPVYAEPVPSVGSKPDPTKSPSSAVLCDEAKLNKMWVVGGSVSEREQAGGKEHLYNTALVINPEGVIVGKHRKVHLFDINVPGKVTFKESDCLSPGNEVTVVDTPWGKIGVGICYDLRFPELAILMRQKGCKMLVYPGAFNMTTGPAHWELLQRARAVDNQVYVASCCASRDKSAGYVAWSHSSVVSPWGEVVTDAGTEANVTVTNVDFGNVDAMRQNIPCWHQKRSDIYETKSSQ